MDEFSINRLSVMLDVDRQTMVRALKDTPADAGTERKPLYRVSTAVTALDQHRGKPDRRRKPGNGRTEVLSGTAAAEAAVAFERYDVAYDAMTKLPTLQARRDAAYKLQPLAKQMLELMHSRDVECDLHPEHVELKNQAVTLLLVKGLESPCEWSHSQAWGCFNADDGEDTEAA
jgi:hypothetical protein